MTTQLSIQATQFDAGVSPPDRPSPILPEWAGFYDGPALRVPRGAPPVPSETELADGLEPKDTRDTDLCRHGDWLLEFPNGSIVVVQHEQFSNDPLPPNPNDESIKRTAPTKGRAVRTEQDKAEAAEVENARTAKAVRDKAPIAREDHPEK